MKGNGSVMMTQGTLPVELVNSVITSQRMLVGLTTQREMVIWSGEGDRREGERERGGEGEWESERGSEGGR